MPSNNIIRADLPDTFYHVYSRGLSKKQIFHSQRDYIHFERLLSRYLVGGYHKKKYYNPVNGINLSGYCLMPNHWHLLIYQEDPGAISKFMQKLQVAYTRYFNFYNEVTGPLMDSRYKSKPVHDDAYLITIIKYIHNNPNNPTGWKYSSYWDYLGSEREWIGTSRITEIYAKEEVVSPI